MKRKYLCAIVLIIAATLMITTSCGKTTAEEENPPEKEKYTAGEDILLDNTAIFPVPEGYQVENNEYYPKTAETHTGLYLQNKKGYVIGITGYESADSKNPYPNPTDLEKEGNNLIIETESSKAFYVPEKRAAYMRVGDITYCLRLLEVEEVDEDTLNDFKEYIKRIKEYSPQKGNCATCD